MYAMTNSLFRVPMQEIDRVRNSVSDEFLRAEILADIFRINALYMIRYTGSGHPGSTFSCMDIATWLWTEEMTNPNEEGNNHSDIYFSSKGHDVPALYAILIGQRKTPSRKDRKSLCPYGRRRTSRRADLGIASANRKREILGDHGYRGSQQNSIRYSRERYVGPRRNRK